jgi:hypothetical protein
MNPFMSQSGMPQVMAPQPMPQPMPQQPMMSGPQPQAMAPIGTDPAQPPAPGQLPGPLLALLARAAIPHLHQLAGMGMAPSGAGGASLMGQPPMASPTNPPMTGPMGLRP